MDEDSGFNSATANSRGRRRLGYIIIITQKIAISNTNICYDNIGNKKIVLHMNYSKYI